MRSSEKNTIKKFIKKIIRHTQIFGESRNVWDLDPKLGWIYFPSLSSAEEEWKDRFPNEKESFLSRVLSGIKWKCVQSRGNACPARLFIETGVWLKPDRVTLYKFEPTDQYGGGKTYTAEKVF